MNTKKTPLDDEHIRNVTRQAIDNYAFERSLKSPRWKAQCRFFPSAIEGYDEADVSTRCNFAEAESALANQKCSLKLDYLGGAGRSAVANELAWQLGKRGVDLKLDPASTGRIFQERLVKREFDLALVSFSSDYLHPHSNAHAMCTNSEWEELNTFDGPHTLAWYCHWRDDALVKVVAHAVGATKDDQSKDYKDIQTGLFDRGPYAFLLEESAYVTGVKYSLPFLGPLNNQTRYSPTQQT
jgi:ABC-type oligopeptide transport system substrate-binding subunit